MSDFDLRAELTKSLKEHSALPYLFLGSGISRRYLGLPDWPGLLRHFAVEMGEDYDFHNASANSDQPKVASSLAQAFHPIWWTSAAYEPQRAEFRSIATYDEAALKIAVATYIRDNSVLSSGKPGVDNLLLAAEIKDLRSATIGGVITTNYDRLTDDLFPAFNAYVGQDELLLSDAQFVGETYKIHGSASQPDSLIFTQKDYERFSKRNHYLAAKLLTIFAEHPVIFIGYSLNDTYIREILENIAAAVGHKRIDELGRRMYFVEWNEDPESRESLFNSSVPLKEGSLPIQRIGAHSFSPVFQSLSALDRPFPAQVLRELRKFVFDLVTEPHPDQGRETLHVVPIDGEVSRDLKVVFGVGPFSDKDLRDISSISGRSLKRGDLARDVLGVRRRGIDAENVLKFGLPSILERASTAFVPVFKYLAETNRIRPDGELDLTDLDDNVRACIERCQALTIRQLNRFVRDVRGRLTTPKEIMASPLNLSFQLDCLLALDPADFDVEELREVLAETFEGWQPGVPQTDLYRAVCHYDRLRYSELTVASIQ